MTHPLALEGFFALSPRHHSEAQAQDETPELVQAIFHVFGIGRQVCQPAHELRNEVVEELIQTG